MKCLVAEWNNRPTVEFKGVPQRVENGFDDMVEPNEIPTSVQPPETVYSMKWGEFKSFCKEQGYKVKGKTRKELMKELGL